jgi:hypothetical protein
MKQMIAPNGLKIVGTADVVNVTADVTGWSDAGEPDYDGGSGSEVDWNSQLTRTNANGVMLVVDENGSIWPKNMCELVDEAKDEAE